MTGFAAPLALLLGLLAAPLVVLYLLRPRREERVVPSTFLWQRALREVEANAPWQRLRRNLLLLLQLAILALLVLALARPLVPSDLAPGGDLVLLLDTSQSMAATDVAPSRSARAVERARRIVRDAGRGSRIALIAAGPTARLLAGPTAEKAEVERALGELGAPHGELNLRDAALLTRSLAGRLQDPTVVLVGDGGPGEVEPEALPYRVRFDPVRASGPNAAVLGVSARNGPGGRQLWVALGNDGPAGAATLSLSVDGRLYDAQRVALPANGTAGRAFDDAPPGAIVEARLDVEDALSADDAGWHVDAGGRATRALLVGPESRFLERALRLLPDVEVFRAPEGSPPAPGYDVYIVTGRVPARLPPGNVLLLNPADSPLLPVRGEVEGLAVTSQDRDHAVLRNVELSSVSVARASRLAPPPWMETLAASGDAPLLVAGEDDGRRVAALAFAPEQSDLPLQVAFPVLVDNLLSYLGPPGAVGALSVRPGEPVALPASASPLAVVMPDGARAALPAGTTTYAAPAAPGVYEARDEAGAVVARWAVNAGSATEYRLGAGADAPLRSTGDGAAAPPRQAAGAERWWPLALLGLGVLLLEWWLYVRRSRGRLRRRTA